MNLSTLSRKTSPTHSFFVQADREYRDNVSMLQCSPGKEKTDLEKSAHISGPNSVKISTPVEELAAQNIKIDKAYRELYFRDPCFTIRIVFGAA